LDVIAAGKAASESAKGTWAQAYWHAFLVEHNLTEEIDKRWKQECADATKAKTPKPKKNVKYSEKICALLWAEKKADPDVLERTEFYRREGYRKGEERPAKVKALKPETPSEFQACVESSSDSTRAERQLTETTETSIFFRRLFLSFSLG
jgi:hypothetical protein